MSTVQAILSGALIGGMFAVMAVGLSLTWGMLRIINLAHFGMILLGAYLTFQLATSWGVDPLLTLAVTVPLMFVLGALLQWAFDRLGVAELNSLLVSFGILIIIIQTVSNVWSADFQRMTGEVNPYATGSLSLGRLVFPAPTLLAFGIAIVLVGAAHLVLQRTFAGRALRAFGQDRSVASAFGIDHRRLSMALAGASGASAAVAGMLFALSNALTPSTPFEWFGTVFAVVILGGIGQILGTLVAGVLVGTLSGLVSVLWSPSLAPFVLFSAIILALLFRPQGLFSQGAAR
ncbi:MAG TPA: branched-chain amino acid ABC transporter permease [Jiangellaceae bacterium]|nr:branched-chain amino acid ABC transporter permease [Jiangellaceae bacterium]